LLLLPLYLIIDAVSLLRHDASAPPLMLIITMLMMLLVAVSPLRCHLLSFFSSYVCLFRHATFIDHNTHTLPARFATPFRH